MGVAASKSDFTAPGIQCASLDSPENAHSGAILTPKASRENLHQMGLDPRSPSKRFARTPVELLSAVANKLETLTIETGSPSEETPLKSHIILRADPRSPSLEVQRTPIVVSALADETFPEGIRNKTLEKVKISDLFSTPATASKCRPRNVAPKLLSSCPVTPKVKVENYKRKSLVLLETNVDYTETDLDEVIREKYLGFAGDVHAGLLITCSSKEESGDEHIIDPVEEQIDANIQSNEPELHEDPQFAHQEPAKECQELQQAEEELEQSQELAPTPPTGPWEEETDSSASLALTEPETKSAPVSPPHIVSVTPKKSQSTSPIRSLAAEVQELDKKLTNLIYEDEDPVVWPRAVKPRDQNRTPLGVRNGNGQTKPVSKLKVSDKPRKLQYNVSKIPVFKDKRIKVQCENTPPRNLKALRQPKKPAWDTKDDTMFI